MINGISSLLLDTNVWLDYCLPMRARHQTALDLINRALECDIVLAIAGASLKDVFYLAASYMKQLIRAEGREVTQADALAIQQIAWQCVQGIDNIAVTVPTGPAEAFLARHYQSICADFEDCLIFGSAETCKANYLVTNDGRTLQHAPCAALSASDALALLR